MAYILINGEVQGELSIKRLKDIINDICSRDNGIYSLPTPLGYKTIIPEENVGLYVLLKFKKILIKKLLIVFIVINLLVSI